MPDTDQPTAALLKDLKQRGMLDDTLIVWGGEFGRTVCCSRIADSDQLRSRSSSQLLQLLLAGGGVKGGMSYGQTDDYSVNVVENPVHVHDLQATILHQLGIDHEN